jgi:hypothetical protein
VELLSAAGLHVLLLRWTCCCYCCLQDPMFDKIIKALYGDVDQYDAEVRNT